MMFLFAAWMILGLGFAFVVIIGWIEGNLSGWGLLFLIAYGASWYFARDIIKRLER